MTAPELTPEQQIIVDAFGIHPESNEPPVAKYQYTLVIRGNSHEEIEREIVAQTRGGYLLDSDAFQVHAGRRNSLLEHRNPDMTPEQYDAELDEWWQRRKAARRAEGRA